MTNNIAKNLRPIKFILMYYLLHLSLNSSYAGDKFYKWTDENGNTHYAEKKPEHIETDEIKINVQQPSKNNDFNFSDTNDEKNTTKNKLDKYAEQDEKRRQKKRKKQALCNKAKIGLKNYKKNISYRKKDQNSGGYVYLTESKRAHKEQKYNKQIAKKLKEIQKICQ